MTQKMPLPMLKSVNVLVKLTPIGPDRSKTVSPLLKK